MGLPKRDHIRAIAALPDVARRWEQTHGRPMTDGDIDTLHARLLPLNLETAAGHASLIPGARNTLTQLRQRGIRIGSTTGYGRTVMDVLMPAAAAEGFTPDCVVCTDDVPTGRPHR